MYPVVETEYHPQTGRVYSQHVFQSFDEIEDALAYIADFTGESNPQPNVEYRSKSGVGFQVHGEQSPDLGNAGHNLTTQEAETIARLATKAREEGVRLYRDRRDGRHYATSATTPGKLYFVTLASCTCPGFISHQRCKHWAALTLAVLNEPEDGDPEAAPATEAATTVDTSAFRPVVEVVHVPGGYEDAGWLVRSGDPVWRETETMIFIDGNVWMSIVGDFNCRAINWTGEDMTESMPTGLDHYAAVEDWIKSATSQPAWEILQRANMMPLAEALDELVAA